jgi:hypothetical protein
MSTSTIDTDITHYTISEMLQILDMDELDENEIIDKTDKYSDDNSNNQQLSLFFQEMQSQLLQYMNSPENTNSPQNLNSSQNTNSPQNTDNAETQTTNWNTNKVLQQSDTNQQSKITDRTQKIDVYNNPQVPMKREQLGINNNYNVNVAQDSLNPNLENKTSRFVNLDSQYRQSTNVIENSASDYTLDLSDPLTNVLNMRLYSYQIPFTWYTIDPAYGNTCFWIKIDTNDPISESIAITIEAGNYTPTEFVVAVNDAFVSAGFTFTPSTTQPVSYNSKNGKITMNLMDGSYNPPSPLSPQTITDQSTIIFYDYTATLQCNTNCVNTSYYINQTLGWVMGYRLPQIQVSSSGNVAPAILDLVGTKYIILVLDDYNQNHINNGLVTITETSKTLKMPSYYSPDLPYTCSRALSQKTNQQLQNLQQTQSNNSNLILTDNLDPNYKTLPQMLPSAPRILTQSQIYTINEIVKNNDNNTNYRTKAPTNTDVFAMLPIKPSGASIGDLLVEFSGSLQDNKRTYFGPVNVERMRIKLVNDKGNVMNLNGADWCITIIADLLYQY